MHPRRRHYSMKKIIYIWIAIKVRVIITVFQRYWHGKMRTIKIYASKTAECTNYIKVRVIIFIWVAIKVIITVFFLQQDSSQCNNLLWSYYSTFHWVFIKNLNFSKMGEIFKSASILAQKLFWNFNNFHITEALD